MADDQELKPAEPEASAAAPPEPAPLPPAASAEPPAPPNKLHEWGAAIGIMVFLAVVLWTFLSFLRSASSSM